ncbi:hypothetical protein [Ramlibacter humi]|uniref:Uncharacterized protein n=1 Tax=Ramlibacter humi TaxID=2530451 RepID=A0A4Z0BHR2_9BURK|nr:hypothetical protein [Ramlibacter humi]TFY98842.1 hypothetical protein EZ216_14810 [Ramlibacter humi]
MATQKKELERHFLNRFLSHLVPPLDGEVEPGEEPDFVIASGGRRIGIEMTELHRKHAGSGRPMQADQAMRKRVIDRAKELYDAEGHPPVHVSVFFNEHHPIQKEAVEPLAKAIVGTIQRNMPASGEASRETYDWVNRAYFPEHFIEISVHNFPVMTQSFFSGPGGTWLVDVTPDDIQRVLDAKEGKYTAYRRRCEEAWLVINCDGEFMSTWFDFDNEALAGPFRSGFERVFIVRHFANAMNELVVRREP